MPASSDTPLLSQWPSYLADIFSLYHQYLSSELTDPAWLDRWQDKWELVEFSQAIKEASAKLRGDMTVIPEKSKLLRKADRETVVEVRRKWTPVWQKYRELRQIIEAYAGVCNVHSVVPDDHLGTLWDSPEFKQYEVVRKWLDARRPRRRAAAKARYRTLMKNPDEKARLAEESRARYYKRLGKPVPEAKRTYKKAVGE